MNQEKGNHRQPDRFGAGDGMPCVDEQHGRRNGNPDFRSRGPCIREAEALLHRKPRA